MSVFSIAFSEELVWVPAERRDSPVSENNQYPRDATKEAPAQTISHQDHAIETSNWEACSKAKEVCVCCTVKWGE